MNAATSIDTYNGCTEEMNDKTSCWGFTSAAILEKAENPTLVPLFTTTPAGPTEKNYRGYEFNPYNGVPRLSDVHETAPLTSDRDLVAELIILPGDLNKAVYARYSATGKDEGSAPVLFADGHAKPYTAKAIKFGKTGILWRFR
jgi:prepilin-type processing-associated H-X9-DG protein